LRHDDAANAVAEELAKHLVDHAEIRAVPNVVAELRLDDAERAFKSE
jgi:hypothetical protein